MPRSPEEDAWEAYEAAAERAEALGRAWADLGKPVLAPGSMKQPVPHPLLKAINEAEVIADRLRERVRKKHAGPEPSAVVTLLTRRRITRKASGG